MENILKSFHKKLTLQGDGATSFHCHITAKSLMTQGTQITELIGCLGVSNEKSQSVNAYLGIIFQRNMLKTEWEAFTFVHRYWDTL